MSGDYEHMYGRQIKFVGEPTESSDAATKNYVDERTGGALQFKGAVNDLNDIVSAKAGDVVIVTSTSKEYVYNGIGQYQLTNWIELGDESLYATAAEVQAMSTDIVDMIGDKVFIDGLSAQSLSVIHIDQEDFY